MIDRSRRAEGFQRENSAFCVPEQTADEDHGKGGARREWKNCKRPKGAPYISIRIRISMRIRIYPLPVPVPRAFPRKRGFVYRVSDKYREELFRGSGVQVQSNARETRRVEENDRKQSSIGRERELARAF